MRFWCDPVKNQINLATHGIALNEVPPLFDGDVLERHDDRRDYDEDRWVAVGILNGIEITVVDTDVDDVRHLISARRATRNERQDFWNARAG